MVNCWFAQEPADAATNAVRQWSEEGVEVSWLYRLQVRNEFLDFLSHVLNEGTFFVDMEVNE
jgi:hypothetical protein